MWAQRVTIKYRSFSTLAVSPVWCVNVLTDHGFLEVVGFDAADEVGLAGCQGLHQSVQRLTELTTQRKNTLLICCLLEGEKRERGKGEREREREEGERDGLE